jgi:protocatechuate 3,4-dioxygenase beta subunit
MHIITSKTLASRRRFLRQLAAGGAFYSMSGLLAEALTLTPRQTQGPFYPMAKNIPLDKDIMNDQLTPAKGIITYVSGRVLDSKGAPIRNALLELWHADDGGEYTFAANAPRNPRADANFAGFGQFLTGADGAYKFRTVKAGLYRGRTRHFHFGITISGQKTRFTTQLYWNEVPRAVDGSVWSTTNDNDGVLRGVRDAEERAAVIRDFTPVPGSAAGEQETTWDIVMGLTPVEQPYPGAEDGVLVLAGTPVPASGDGKPRFKIAVPAQAGYSYEVYANPSVGKLGWAALPFSLRDTEKPDRNIHTAPAEGRLDLYVQKESVRGYYHVTYRVPGANLGTPGEMRGGFGGPGGPPPRPGRPDGPPPAFDGGGSPPPPPQ